MTTKKDDGIVWEEPPPSRASGGVSLEVKYRFDVLKANPGKWARVDSRSGEVNRSRASVIAYYANRKFGPEFEFCTRSLPEEGVRAIYARYVGNGKD